MSIYYRIRRLPGLVQFFLLAVAIDAAIVVLGLIGVNSLTSTQQNSAGLTNGHDSVRSQIIGLVLLGVLTAAGHKWAAKLRYWFVLGYVLALAIAIAGARSETDWSAVSVAAGALALAILIAPWITLSLRVMLFFLPGVFQPTTGPRAELRASRARRRVDELH